eukprot:15811866-Heterocapsa_arctica.AAC.1
MGPTPGAVPSVPAVPAFPWENSSATSRHVLSMGRTPTPKNWGEHPPSDQQVYPTIAASGGYRPPKHQQGHPAVRTG